MPKQILWIIIALTFGALLIGCGGASNQNEIIDTEPAGGDPVEEAPPPAEMSASDMGKKVGDLYIQAIGEVADALESRPEPAAARESLEQLKEKFVSQLVEYGKKREALSASDKASMDSAIRMTMNRVPMDLFQKYGEAQNHYMKADRELGDLISSFNVITQYANFDLLKQQEPEEAQRLGIN
jgi:hypothetical protein